MSVAYDLGRVTGGFIILGYYATLVALQAAVTAPAVGDAYGVGSAAPYTVYVWDGVTSAWLDNGTLKGEKGDIGATGATGQPGPQGPKGDTGDIGSQGPAGLDGANGKDFVILGYYTTLAALQAAVATPAAGDAYGVGNAAPYTIYVYDGANGQWVDCGNLQGPAGADGAKWWTASQYSIMQYFAVITYTSMTGFAAASSSTVRVGDMVLLNDGKACVIASVYDTNCFALLTTAIVIKGDTGLTGATGAQGGKGDTGAAGPNLVSATTATSLTGLLKGNGSNIVTAVAGTDYLAAETDPTVPTWAKASTKPTYTATEVGAASSIHEHSGVYLPIAGGTLTGAVAAHTGTDYTTYRCRNIALDTTAATPANGALLGVYS